ncbi:MAG: DUF192 domain-containing protein [Actinobacteria bacterium]|nr:DUF192 domain-containing protein [Actinomycetota bacterium]
MSTASPSGNWLVRDDRVLATLEIAATRRDRRRGLLGRDGIEGAMMLAPARSVHTFGMKFAIDVAHLDAHGVVLRMTTMKPNRLGAFVARSRSVIETEAGALARWGVAAGDVLEAR